MLITVPIIVSKPENKQFQSKEKPLEHDSEPLKESGWTLEKDCEHLNEEEVSTPCSLFIFPDNVQDFEDVEERTSLFF